MVTPTGLAFTLQVVAIGRLPNDVSTVYQDVQGSLLDPGVLPGPSGRDRPFPGQSRTCACGGAEADLAAFGAAARRLANQASARSPRRSWPPTSGRRPAPRSVALGLFAMLAALASLVMIGQIMARELLLATGDGDTLRALGLRAPGTSRR